MATEYRLESYYDKKYFIDTHFLSKLAISSYLAAVTFKSDISRVIYAPLEMTFRRRMETVDIENGIGNASNFNPKSLNLPYGSFYQEEEWQDDDRVYSKQAIEAVHGLYIEELSMRLPSKAVKCKYKITLFFNREDDRRIAHQLWLFEKSMGVPILMKVPVNFKGKKLEIPVNITIDTISTSKEYKQQDHLEKARILPMSLDFTVRSYQIFIPFIQEHTPLPFKFMGSELKDWYKPDFEPRIATSYTLTTVAGKLYKPTNWVEPTLQEFDITKFEEETILDVDNALIHDLCKGFFEDAIPIGLKTFIFDDIKDTTALLKYELLDKTEEALERMEIMFPSLKPFVITDFTNKEYLIEGLYPNSEYHVVILLYLKSGETKTYTLNITTMNNDTNQAPTTINKRYGKLVGKRF